MGEYGEDFLHIVQSRFELGICQEYWGPVIVYIHDSDVWPNFIICVLRNVQSLEEEIIGCDKLWILAKLSINENCIKEFLLWTL